MANKEELIESIDDRLKQAAWELLTLTDVQQEGTPAAAWLRSTRDCVDAALFEWAKYKKELARMRVEVQKRLESE